MVFSAGRGASVIAVTVVHTLVAPCLADEEGQGLGELGDVGTEAVATLARVLEGVGVAGVLVCGGGLGGWLQTDQLEAWVSRSSFKVNGTRKSLQGTVSSAAGTSSLCQRTRRSLG